MASCDIGKLPTNRAKNRYANIFACKYFIINLYCTIRMHAYINTQMIFHESNFSSVMKMKLTTLTAAILMYVCQVLQQCTNITVSYYTGILEAKCLYCFPSSYARNSERFLADGMGQ